MLKFCLTEQQSWHPQLLQKDKQWEWSDKQEESFQEVKWSLSSSKLLVHFDDQKLIVLACDASSFGIAAVFSHILDDGTEHTIA